MSKAFDASLKHLVEAHPADWLNLAGLPITGELTVIDADVASVSAAADKVIRVGGDAPYIVHLEFQANPDEWLDLRTMFYNVLLRRGIGCPCEAL